MKMIINPRICGYVARPIIFLIMIVLIIGTVGCHTHGYPCLEVQTWYDLDAVRNNLNGNHILMNDLDSAAAGYEELASPTANGGKGWQPIGTFVIDYSLSFGGIFDGQGYEISDLFINRPDEGDIGLFGSVKQDGLITNIGVVNFTMSGFDRVGGLAGASGGTVSSSYTKGNVTGGEWGIGGLVGSNWGTVINCYCANNVTGHVAVGGLVGQNHRGSVSNSYSTDNVTGQEGVGGVVGVNYFGIVSNSYSSGSVTGGYIVGGLVGANAGNVTDCYSTGSVTGIEDVGGLVGDNYQGNVNRSFWDVQTSGQASSDGGTGKTTAEMRDVATFVGAGWDIMAVAYEQTNSAYTWNIIDGETYPFLSWQVQTET